MEFDIPMPKDYIEGTYKTTKLLDDYRDREREFLIDQINEEIVSGRFYQALKLSQKLIDYEQEVISRVQ